MQYVKFLFVTILWLCVAGLIRDAGAMDDPIKDRRVIADLEVVMGDASADAIVTVNYQTDHGELYPDWGPKFPMRDRFDRNDAVICGNLIGDGRDEILVAYGKKRKKKVNLGWIIVYDQNMQKSFGGLDVRYEDGDGLAVGKVLDDPAGFDQVVIGSRARNTLEIWSLGKGSAIAAYPVGYEQNDEIAVGDLDADGIDEIVMGDASSDVIRIFKFKGWELEEIAKFSGEGIFDIKDDLAVGDVDGDGLDEIVFVDGTGEVRFFNGDGGEEYPPIHLRYDQFSQVVVGDVDADGNDEIVVAYSKDDSLIAYDLRGRPKKGPFLLVGWERFDYLALGDLDGDSLEVGPPKPPRTMTLQDQVVAVINAPPKENSLMRQSAENLFYATFERTEESRNGLVVKAEAGVMTTRRLDFNANALVLRGKTKIKMQTESRRSTTSAQELVKTVGYGFIADKQDVAVTVSTTYQLWAYPIVSPKWLATTRDGTQQYIVVSVPVSMSVNSVDRALRYMSASHVNGYVASYPTRKDQLYHYDRTKEIGSHEFNVQCDGRYFTVGITNSDITVDESKSTSSLKISSDTVIDALALGAQYKTSSEAQRTWMTTHTVSFTESTRIGVHLKSNAFEYCSTGYATSDKYYYKVGMVAYYDSEDGHLVLDYYVPEKSPFFKPPPKPAPPKPILMKVQQSSPANRFKGPILKPGLLKLPGR